MLLRDAIAGRRSVRHFSRRAVADELIHELILAACAAPAPHHTRPWRFVLMRSEEAKAMLARAMGEAWRRDLIADGQPPDLIERLLARSYRRLMEAPVLVLACLVGDGLRAWPDERRRRSEWTMAAQSMGAALQNLMLTAYDRGLASYWISAPLFCQETVRVVLDLPSGFVPQALVALGYPQPNLSLPPRLPLYLKDVLLYR